MRRKYRRLAIVAIVVFVVVSAALHFTIGSAVATLFPTWRYAPAPDQAISIISLSHKVIEQRQEPPTPSPTAPPKIVMRTSTHIVPLKYREITRFEKAQLASIVAPSRRISTLYVVGPQRPKPGAQDAPASGCASWRPELSGSPARSRAPGAGLRIFEHDAAVHRQTVEGRGSEDGLARRIEGELVEVRIA